MRQNDRQGILVLRSDVNEVDPETVNLRAKLRQPIQSARNTTPIVARAPVLNEALCFGQRYPLGPIRYWFLVRPPTVGKSLFHIDQPRLWHIHLQTTSLLHPIR